MALLIWPHRALAQNDLYLHLRRADPELPSPEIMDPCTWPHPLVGEVAHPNPHQMPGELAPTLN